MPRTIYISSVFSEFKEIRKVIRQKLNENRKLYTFIGMEDYGSEDRGALDKCVEDVMSADFYILILGTSYGSKAEIDDAMKERLQKVLREDLNQELKELRSYTHWEHITAIKRKKTDKRLERKIYIKQPEGCDEFCDEVKQWRNDALVDKILCKFFSKDEELPQLLLDDLNEYIDRKSRDTKDFDLRYKCDWVEPEDFFLNNLLPQPVQCFLLHSHNRNMPANFIKRKKLDFEAKQNHVMLLELQLPRTLSDAKDVESLEKKFKTAIFKKLDDGHKFMKPDDITIPGLLGLLEQKKMKYLIITWEVERNFWTKELLKPLIESFHKKCVLYNEQFNSDKQIIFFAMAKYIDDPTIAEQLFDEKVKGLSFGYVMPKLPKITKYDVLDWLEDFNIEPNPDKAEKMIAQLIEGGDQPEFEKFMSELDGPLKEMIDKSENLK
ncbi:MAG: DUF4062 domain-containing protein [Bacteroidetes bacterium]|nr:MAG: DUF4062 domain-containing protein [Bacteroidota bacterium]